MNLFDMIEPAKPTLVSAELRPPPQIKSKGITEVFADFETNGLRWWETDRPCGVGVCLPDGTTSYTAWGHRGGGNNISEDNARAWMKAEFEGVLITNLNTRFDVHMAREFGVDFEALGCRVSDVGHYAALLDDHRLTNSLESLVRDMVPDEEKVKIVHGITLDGRRMAEYPASVVAVRAMGDVRQVWKLKNLMWPKLSAEELHRVRQLEDDVIYPVCEMERNGALINMELVEKLIRLSQKEYGRLLMELARAVGFKVNPNSGKDKKRLFEHLKIPMSYTDMDSPSFTDEIVKSVKHPIIQLMRRAIKVKSANSKLRKYQTVVDSKGILRYGLHQLRAIKSDMDDAGESGTVSGRFASTEIVDGVGTNIQQVWKAAKQRVAFGYDEDDASHDEEIFLIRQVHVPEQGCEFLSADAMQIEYRLFADKTRSQRILDAYAADPMMSFHKFMHRLLKQYQPNLTYRRAKDLSFAKIYGAGIKKLALMLEFITKEQFERLNREKARRSHPLLEQAAQVEAIYNREMPEVKPLLERAMHIAKSECDEECRLDDASHQAKIPHRGFVRTILGRRTRFPGNRRRHKALNGVIQGTAADIMKTKLVELHRERKYTGFKMRYTVHDEVDGDSRSQECTDRVTEVLNEQSFPQITVPILWEVSTGENWRDCA